MNTEKKLSDYLPFYIGCEVKQKVSTIEASHIYLTGFYTKAVSPLSNCERVQLFTNTGDVFWDDVENIAAILRRLSSMTEEERIEVASMVSPGEDPAWVKHMAATTVWYFKKGFWLFGDNWFTEGLIIDKDKV